MSNALLIYLKKRIFCAQNNIEWANCTPHILRVNTANATPFDFAHIKMCLSDWDDIIGIGEITPPSDKQIEYMCNDARVKAEVQKIESEYKSRYDFYTTNATYHQWSADKYYPKGE